MTTTDELEALANDLERKGETGLRLELVRRARSFKRSWVEMAEGLVRARESGAYRAWGYPDFHRYCAVELKLKAATVDKLVGSYAMVERHAPAVLDRDGLERAIPEVDSVDYFARALRGDTANDGASEAPVRPAELVEELRHAVFDEGLPVSALRKRFDPVLRPKSEEDERAEALYKASAATRRLLHALEAVHELDESRREEIRALLETLQADLDGLAAQAAAAPPRRAVG